MRTNSDGSVILIENPRTGSESFGRALGLAPDTRFTRWAKPNDVRGEIAGWRDAQKIVLVRNPYTRFVSAAQLAFLYLEQALVGMPVDFADMLEGVKNASPLDKGRAILAFIREGGEVPEFLEPQTGWLNCRVNLVVATPDIAQYFNSRGGNSCIRSNVSQREAGAFGRTVSASLTDVELAYAEDYELFSRLSLWSPDPTRVRLVEGFCATCPRKPTSDSPIISASELGGEEMEPILHVRAKVPRKRKGLEQTPTEEVEPWSTMS